MFEYSLMHCSNCQKEIPGRRMPHHQTAVLCVHCQVRANKDRRQVRRAELACRDWWGWTTLGARCLFELELRDKSRFARQVEKYL